MKTIYRTKRGWYKGQLTWVDERDPIIHEIIAAVAVVTSIPDHSAELSKPESYGGEDAENAPTITMPVDMPSWNRMAQMRLVKEQQLEGAKVMAVAKAGIAKLRKFEQTYPVPVHWPWWKLWIGKPQVVQLRETMSSHLGIAPMRAPDEDPFRPGQPWKAAGYGND